MSKKLLSVGIVMVLVAAVLVGVGANTASAQTANMCTVVESLILAGVIPADKVVAARAAASCGTATAPAAYTFTRDLTIGSTGADVTALQTLLGVTPATGYFGAITKAAVVAYQTSKGISATGYVGPLTRAALNYVAPVVVPPTTGGTTGGSALEGGAGDLTLSNTSTDVENSLKEGEENVNVLGFKAEADGSDIKVTSIKVTLENASSTDGTSEKLSNYLDGVSIYMGSKKVGSADVSDFTKTSGTPDSFSKTISLSDAVVGENDDDKFYVAVSAVSNIDTEDITADISVDVDTVRFTDATGAIMTGDLTDVDAQVFSFNDVSTDDQIDIRSSSSNPDDDTVKVEANAKSEDTLALVFKLDVDQDSSDVVITSLPVTLTVASAGTTTDSIENIIDAVTVTINGNDYDADLTTDNIENGSSTAIYTVDFNDDEFTINSGDVEDVKVYLTFNDQDGNYDSNTTVVASVVPGNIDAETSSDEITVGGGTKTGATLTLDLTGALVTSPTWSVSNTGTIVDFFFTVEAQDEDVAVLASSILDSVAGTASTTDTSGTPETTSKGVLTRYSGDDADAIGSTGFTVAQGDTVTFRVRYNMTGATNGLWKEVTITSAVGKTITDTKQTSPTATITTN